MLNRSVMFSMLMFAVGCADAGNMDEGSAMTAVADDPSTTSMSTDESMCEHADASPEASAHKTCAQQESELLDSGPDVTDTSSLSSEAPESEIIQSTPATISVAGRSWKLLWGPSKISAAYLHSHGKRWISRTFVPGTVHALGSFRCWNNNDHGKARLRIYNVATHKYIGSSGWQDCDWVFSYVQTTSYRPGEGLRLVLEAQGNAHTTYVAAYQA